MSNSVRPHRWQPTRLPHPWDSPGKNTGVGCHFLLQFMKVKSESEVAQLCPTLRDPMNCSLPGSSLHPWDFPGKSATWLQLEYFRKGNSFKNSKRFHSSIQRKITNANVESTVGEKRYFKRGVLMCKGSRFGKVTMEVTVPSLHHPPGERLIFFFFNFTILDWFCHIST